MNEPIKLTDRPAPETDKLRLIRSDETWAQRYKDAIESHEKIERERDAAVDALRKTLNTADFVATKQNESRVKEARTTLAAIKETK